MQKPIKISDLEKFRLETEIHETVDYYESLLDELFQIRNPWTKMKKEYKQEFEAFRKEHLGNKTISEVGEWFYFPWNKILAHYLSDELHQEIRTARNKDVITGEEQKKLYDTTIAVAGLSVGSHAALTVTMMGMACNLKLA